MGVCSLNDNGGHGGSEGLKITALGGPPPATGVDQDCLSHPSSHLPGSEGMKIATLGGSPSSASFLIALGGHENSDGTIRISSCRDVFSGRCSQVVDLGVPPPPTHGGSDQDSKKDSIVSAQAEAADNGGSSPPSPPATGVSGHNNDDSDGSESAKIAYLGVPSSSVSFSTALEGHQNTISGDQGSKKNSTMPALSGDQDSSSSFSFLTALSGHQNTITGIAYPSGSDKLFSVSSDGTILIWDALTGRCIQAVDLGVPVGCLITEGSLVFAGARGAVNGCHVPTGVGVTLPGPAGQVYSLATSEDTLFAGVEDGTILAWKVTNVDGACCTGPAATMLGHTSAVVSLGVGYERLYSGSTDCTIRAWDLKTLQCTITVSGHTDAVMAVICWSRFLLTGSLDGTIRVWAKAREERSGELEEVYKHQEEHGVLVLKGMGDYVLMCSLDDNSIRMYDLPSFSSRGEIHARGNVRAIHTDPDGLFFTGDATGDLRVWRWSSPAGGSQS